MQPQTWLIVVVGVLLAWLWLGIGLTQAATNTLTVSATVLSGHKQDKCKFIANNSTLNFGSINPDSSSDAVATTSVELFCKGKKDDPAIFLVSQDGGLYATGTEQNRMKHLVANEYLPYNLQFNPASGEIPRNKHGKLDETEIQEVTITGTVYVNNFQNARMGNYKDTVIISVIP